MKSGQVKLQGQWVQVQVDVLQLTLFPAHDFFSPQPVKNAAVYFLRHIIHDWPDKDAKKILDSLRTAAGAHSKLIIFEGLAKHVTEEPDSGAQRAPYPLLPNSGAEFLTTLDMGVRMDMVWIE